ncbi:uncharacterized protein LOC111941255 isoform X3 [Cyanistes caeruleus]|uniref:uncharacterized protein LOC111941255 isoform X3 n=1 Tax=Cyanistes caeruleus TaxID=156563 RepID=UPI000CD9FF8B|nr:uncharacterized protein LOC111941255 isoform X3 [Cyanistes caeruleus]
MEAFKTRQELHLLSKALIPLQLSKNHLRTSASKHLPDASVTCISLSPERSSSGESKEVRICNEKFFVYEESLNIQVHKGRSLKIKHPFLKLRIRKVSRLGPSQHAKHPEAKKQFTAHRLHRTEEHRGNIESLFLLGKKIKPAKTFLSFDGHFLRVVVSLPAADVGDTENKKAKIKFTLKIK